MLCKRLSVLLIFLSFDISIGQQPVEECPNFEETDEVDMINEKVNS